MHTATGDTPVRRPVRRPVRSFVVRAGRVTPAQQRALEQFWPRYGLELADAAQPPVQIWGREAPRVLEIGFGMGDSLIDSAAAHPQLDWLGIDVYPAGIGHCLLRAATAGLDNLRLMHGDALPVLETLPAQSFDALWLLFPDPWPKKRHHKRRIVQAGFLDRVHRVLKPSGRLVMATDWADYAEWMGETVARHGGFEPAALPAGLPQRPETKYERRAARAGRPITDFMLRPA